MKDVIVVKNDTFTQIYIVDNKLIREPLILNANIGNEISIEMSNVDDGMKLINGISKIFSFETLIYTRNDITLKVVMEDVDYMDLSKDGRLKMLNNTIRHMLASRDMIAIVVINGKVTDVGMVE